jgi:vitamin B12 transporter
VRIATLLIAAAFAPGVAAAQDASEGAEIVVTGTGLGPAPGSATDAVVVIDRDRLTSVASGRIEDVLRDAAGFAQFRRSDSRSANPTSQGANLRGLGGNASSRVLLLLDGVPQTDPFGGWIAFPAYQAERLSSIRVTRGGGSGFFGPGALSGTIELDSVRPGEVGTLSASLLGGSRGSVEGNAVGSVRAGDGFMLFAGQYMGGDGFQPIVEGAGPVDRAAPYEQASGTARFVTDLGGVELQANLGGFVDRRDRGTDFTAIRSEGAGASVRLVGRGRWQWSALAYLQTRAFASGFASVGNGRASVAQVLAQYVPATGSGARVEIGPPLGEGIELRFGADVRRVSGRTQELYQFVDLSPTRRRIAGGASTTAGLFADLGVETDAWEFSAGARIDHWRIDAGRLDERLLAGGVLTDTVFAARDGWEATGRVGAAFRPVETVTLRTAAYRGWRLPTLNELYRPFRAGADATAANAALSPERLTGGEVGIEWRQATGVRFGVTGFVSRLNDAIANVTIARGPGTFPGVGFVSAAGSYRRRENLDAIESVGVEADIAVTRGAWSLAVGYSHADARVRSGGVAGSLDGLRPAQTAVDQLSATIGWQRERLRAAVTVRHVGAQFEDDQNDRTLAPATTLDAHAELPVTGRIALVARAENLTDTRVEAAISGDGVVERAPPRTVWAGVKLAL